MIGHYFTLVFLGLLALGPANAGIAKNDAANEGAPPAKLRVLSIGINEYPVANWSIKYGIADAKAVGAAFEKVGKTAAFQGVEVTYLLGRDATVNATIGALRKLAHESSPDDVIVFCFSGQGRPFYGQSELKQYIFAMADTAWTDDPKTRTKGISSVELAGLLREIPSRRQIVLLDSYQSADALLAVHAALNADPTFTLKALNRRFALLGLEGPDPEDDKLGHGMLVYAVMKGLAGEADANRDGVITEAELEGYLTWKIPSVNAATFKGQMGEIQLASYSTLRDLRLSVSGPRRGFTETGDSPETQAAPEGKDYALIIAGDLYDNWPKLNNPLWDAEILKKELETNYGYTAKILPNPTKLQVFEALTSLRQSLKKADRALIYVAGHGDFNETTRLGYLVTKDSKPPGSDPFGLSYMALSEFKNMVDGFPADQILVVLDACFGGSFDHQIAISGERGNKTENTISKEQLILRKRQHRSRFYLASGGLRGVADGDPGRHSPFARTFLRVLGTHGGDREIVDKSAIEIEMSRLNPKPMMGPFSDLQIGGDFVFVAKSNPTPVLDPSLQ